MKRFRCRNFYATLPPSVLIFFTINKVKKALLATKVLGVKKKVEADFGFVASH